jgi:hypothetical protein
LRGSKSQLYEGGIRVPLVIKWPRCIPKNRVSNQVTCNIDFLPTLLEATGAERNPEQMIDGMSILENLKAPETVDNQRTLYWHYPLDQPHFLGGKSAGALLKAGRWKLIKGYQDNDLELYDLESDLAESTRIENRKFSLAQELSDELAGWRNDIAARSPSHPKLIRPNRLLFGDCFSPGTISSRWFFAQWYETEAGVLKRSAVSGENKRTFVRNPAFGNSMIRFDFTFGSANDVRLVTGTKGIYNTVIHIRPDCFFIQTASDKTVPYFPSYQGLCSADFHREKWYTMTVEFLDDVVVAHCADSPQAFAYAVHPMINRNRTYLAIQTDEPGAAFDNFELYDAKAQKNAKAMKAKLLSEQKNRTIGKRLEPWEEYRFLKANTIDQLYRNDTQYRALVGIVEAQKKKQQENYPDVFSSIKQTRKLMGAYRTRLKETDPGYSQMSRSINQAKRAMEDYVFAKNPHIKMLPQNQQKSKIETTKQELREDEGFQVLVKQLANHEAALLEKFPRLALTNDQIQAKQRLAREQRREDPEFKMQIKSTAAAVHAERDYLFAKSPRLKVLHQILFEKK